jgi:CheY-like chemotaxis protein
MNGAKDIYLDSGFDDFISKPINSNELKKIIEKYRLPALNQVSDIKLHVR